MKNSAAEVLIAFLRLGCTSFGGPVAHLGYLRNEFVERRKWCSDRIFAELVGLAQSLPGPASSQVAFALGLLRARWLGGIAAWVGFTLPSALMMVAAGLSRGLFTGAMGLRVVHGLQVAAVAVVAQAILAMQRSLAPDKARMALALIASGIAMFAPPAWGTLLAIAVGAVAGWIFLRTEQREEVQDVPLEISRAQGIVAASGFVILLLLLPLVTGSLPISVFNAFYRTGALVFGGGHVVLPLLENEVVSRGWVDQQTFLSGYGAVQAVPGPLFTLAAYLGAAIQPTPSPLLMGAVALAAIFLPGLLLMVAVLPFWSFLRQQRPIQAALCGVNAGVLGVLIAAFYQPVWTSTVRSSYDFLLALTAFVLLTLWKVPPWILVLGCALLAR